MYYGIKGKPGFLHSACLDEYCAKHGSYDAQSRLVNQPQVESMTPTPPAASAFFAAGGLRNSPSVSTNGPPTHWQASRPICANDSRMPRAS